MFFKSTEIDLRSEMNRLQHELSYDILYNRTTKFIKCKCYDNVYQSGNPKCQTCFGTGRLTSLEKLNVIEYTPTLKEMGEGSIGAFSRHEKHFYFSYKTAPKRKDLIMMTGWNKDKTPTNLIQVYEVKDVDVVRGDNGRVEFYRVLGVLVPDLKRQMQDAVNRIPSEGRRLLGRGRRYVWSTKNQ